MSRAVCQVVWLGKMGYLEAWELQRRLAEARSHDTIPDTLLLLEHPPTYTLGRRGKEQHLLADREDLEKEGITVFRVDRGGDITFHGPGQLVGYPVVSLLNREGGASKYLRNLEECIILGLDRLGILAERLPGFTGVWVGGDKIAAIGVKINARRVTSHGFALNVTTDLSYFSKIIPCGILDRGVTSLSKVLNRPVSLDEVARIVSKAFGLVFDLAMVKRLPGECDIINAFDLGVSA